MKIKRRLLTKLLEEIPGFEKPKIGLEQYVLPSEVASRLLWIAELTYNDISGKTVVDFGCGTGRLTIGAVFMGANYVIGIDIDYHVLTFLKKTLESRFKGLSHKVDLICTDVRLFNVTEKYKRKITIIQNPPFGVHRKGYDIYFLDQATKLGGVIYTVHKSSTKLYVKQYMAKKGFDVVEVFDDVVRIPMSYRFHRKKFHNVNVTIFRCSLKTCKH